MKRMLLFTLMIVLSMSSMSFALSIDEPAQTTVNLSTITTGKLGIDQIHFDNYGTLNPTTKTIQEP